MKTRIILFFFSSLFVYVGFQTYSFMWLIFGLLLFVLACRKHRYSIKA